VLNFFHVVVEGLTNQISFYTSIFGGLVR